MMAKEVKILLKSFIYLLLIFILFLFVRFLLLYLFSDSPVFSQKIKTSILNNVDFNSDDSIILKSEILSSDIIYTFYLMKESEEVPFLEFKIVSGVESEPSYKVIDNYLYIWLGDTFYNLDNSLLKEERNKMDTRLYQYDLKENELKELKLSDRRKTMILDIILDESKNLYIIKEKATRFQFPNKWVSSKAYINNEELSTTLTNMTDFRSNALLIDNKLLLPTYEGIVKYDFNAKIEVKEKYRYDSIIEVICTLIDDYVYVSYFTKEGVYLEKLERDFTYIDSLFIESVDSQVIGNGEIYYYKIVDENLDYPYKARIVEVSLTEMLIVNNFHIELENKNLNYLRAFYNKHTNQIQFYSSRES